MPTKEKLVRDRIPEIIAKSGRTPETRIIQGKEHFDYLDRKLDEEVGEFHSDKNLEELADIFEVIVALAGQLGYSEEQLFETRKKKRLERGGFEKGIVLIQ